MSEGFLRRSLKVIDVSQLTAISSDVRSGKKFYGSQREAIGSMPERGTISQQLPINGTYNGPSGYYAGGTIGQSIEVSFGTTLNPGAVQVAANVIGKYMQGNVTIAPVTNLIPENIKKNVTVGGVTGTWEGYVSTDQYEPYRYGAYPEGQSITAMRYLKRSNVDTDTIGELRVYDTYMSLVNKVPSRTSSNPYETTGIVFNVPLDLTNMSKLKVEYQVSDTSNSERLFVGVSSQFFTDYMNGPNSNARYTAYDYFAPETELETAELDITGVYGSCYIYIGNPHTSRTGGNYTIVTDVLRVVVENI